jgi:hypothetical protein
MKSENHKTCQDVMISHVEVVIKKLRRFRISCYVRCFQILPNPCQLYESSSEMLKRKHRWRSEMLLVSKARTTRYMLRADMGTVEVRDVSCSVRAKLSCFKLCL